MSQARAKSGAEVAVALFVVAIVAMMVVPLPTVLIDLLIAINLCIGVLLIAAALYVRDALRFSAFPTLLLLSTLYRLALNVSSTRLILLQADAGRVIEGFGHFVVRGDYRVGALVFAMLTLIQFVVIARGAERVAEVAARFSLDALPGKQMALDAEVRAGTLSPDRARDARTRLERESQLHGALDGALKFVKGDAIAGVIITLVNFVGGVSLGVLARDLPLAESLTTYGLLTIGDGLVTQIPALLGATAAGLVVTRVTPEAHGGSLARDLLTQLVGEPRALWLGALVLLGLALVPGLPSWPFLPVALAAALLGFRSHRVRPHDDALAPEPLTLALGGALAERLLSRDAPGHMLSDALDAARRDLTRTLGIELPAPRIRRDRDLPPHAYRWDWRELPEPALQATTPDHSADAIGQSLRALGGRHAADCLTLEHVQQMIDRLERTHPALVRLTVPRPLAPAQLAEVLRRLASEGVSVRWLAEIVEAVAPHAGTSARVDDLVEHARRALARRISHALAAQGDLHVLRLAPEVEETLTDALRSDDRGDVLALPAELAQEIADAVRRAHDHAPRPHALVTQAALRRHVRALLAESAPNLPVVSAYELTPNLRLSLGDPIGP
ncbi:MAG: flagellar biosynthesis protein FlhA [Polyangiales bacterium]